MQLGTHTCLCSKHWTILHRYPSSPLPGRIPELVPIDGRSEVVYVTSRSRQLNEIGFTHPPPLLAADRMQSTDRGNQSTKKWQPTSWKRPGSLNAWSRAPSLSPERPMLSCEESEK